MITLTEEEINGFNHKEVEEQLFYVKYLLIREKQESRIEYLYKYRFLLEQRKETLFAIMSHENANW
ncbi:hypothetical protein [Adhaeribacter aquaticus]|uniref:hypothetical protein n=1 Tax=Adhaeribacter aquaticus TaxID=299567 RepID=UPI000426ED68|nr:hypothetical protein [Adhaeribacter aquaticus]